MMNALRPMLSSTTKRSLLQQPVKSLARSNSRFITSSSSAPLKSASTGRRDTVYVIAAFATVTALFSTIASSVHLRLDSAPIGKKILVGGDGEEESKFLFATGGKDIRGWKGPVFSRDEVTAVFVIGGPLAGSTGQVNRIAERFDFQVESADSDIYSDIALNLPTARFSNPHGASQLRIVVDDFARTSSDPLAQALQFEEDVAPILCFIFVDTPLADALKRAPVDKREAIQKEYKEWETRMNPLIKHYRDKANFLEITGQWPADEAWEQVEAKLESALELESRGEL